MSTAIEIIVLAVPVFGLIYAIWLRPLEEDRMTCYRKAVSIAQYFGEKSFSLKEFKTPDGGVFVFVQDYDEKRYCVFSRWYTARRKSYEQEKKRAYLVCSLFSSHIPHYFDIRSYDEFMREAQGDAYEDL
jgi:hypothetical protein